MKITPEDMEAVRDVLRRSARIASTHPSGFHNDEQRDIALALILVRIYDRGYEDAFKDISFGREMAPKPLYDPNCPFTQSHTREWCGYEGCRES